MDGKVAWGIAGTLAMFLVGLVFTDMRESALMRAQVSALEARVINIETDVTRLVNRYLDSLEAQRWDSPDSGR